MPMGSLTRLSLTALGVVFGDIGTSPLYAVRACFQSDYGILPNPENILGVLSLIFWSLILVISIKYLTFVLHADNHGEGGILALMALVHPAGKIFSKRRRLLVALGLFGAALLYGDSTITPAISVLSAVEGLEVATVFSKHYIVALTIMILIALFIFQRQGTLVVGSVFAPVMLVWILIIAILGISGIIHRPEVVAAIHPLYAVNFFMSNGWQGFIILSLVFLVVTGGEALYADMGHFGKAPIRLAWFCLVLPALLLNYFGQGALLLESPHKVTNPFYLLAPPWALYPLAFIACLATVIASQAVISGAFSLTRQAIQLGYCPRMKIVHTSAEEVGQVYLGTVNKALMVVTIGLVLAFRESTNLAVAYGVAVSATMVITTILTGVVANELWGWSKLAAAIVAVLFLSLDLSFFSANLVKIISGGWFPIGLAAVVFLLMSTWRRGRMLLENYLREKRIPLESYLEDFELHPPQRVEGTAIFLTGSEYGVPSALLYQLKHNKVLHEQVLLLTIITENVPKILKSDRIAFHDHGQGFYRVVVRHGFMEMLNVPRILTRLKKMGLEINMKEASFFVGQENIIPVEGFRMNYWRATIFAFMARNAMPITAFFKIPHDRVIELGVYVEL